MFSSLARQHAAGVHGEKQGPNVADEDKRERNGSAVTLEKRRKRQDITSEPKNRAQYNKTGPCDCTVSIGQGYLSTENSLPRHTTTAGKDEC